MHTNSSNQSTYGVYDYTGSSGIPIHSQHSGQMINQSSLQQINHGLGSGRSELGSVISEIGSGRTGQSRNIYPNHSTTTTTTSTTNSKNSQSINENYMISSLGI